MSEDCPKPAGVLKPIIDPNRCEGKEDCVAVCPFNVFEVRKLSDEERGGLSFVARMKVFVHGAKQAFAVRAEECHACGKCVTACPEKAIQLRAVS